jgi:hypothetical protein
LLAGEEVSKAFDTYADSVSHADFQRCFALAFAVVVERDLLEDIHQKRRKLLKKAAYNGVVVDQRGYLIVYIRKEVFVGVESEQAVEDDAVLAVRHLLCFFTVFFAILVF